MPYICLITHLSVGWSAILRDPKITKPQLLKNMDLRNHVMSISQQHIITCMITHLHICLCTHRTHIVQSLYRDTLYLMPGLQYTPIYVHFSTHHVQHRTLDICMVCHIHTSAYSQHIMEYHDITEYTCFYTNITIYMVG